MRLYLDDDSAEALLVALLRREGHDPQVPADVGLAGEYDPVHLRHAVREDRVLLSRNHDDFQRLHDLIKEVQGHYPGLLIVRRAMTQVATSSPQESSVRSASWRRPA